ncbi:GIY-YIG nuclease family protein [Sagittula sp. NFXS13]|uniref:GIY-YIG nuclease family protein n=1 Tax=Sagittula sp. NFXS13 TaxID=2819095 RepID=UPI0032DE8F20
MSTGRSLELYFVDGKPDGMLTAEVFNWTGHVLRVPKVQLTKGLARPEARQTGVYILSGENQDGPLAYIGEAEDMASRLKDHAAKKDWWDTAVLITTAGDALHKAHVKYLESRLVEIAKTADQCYLENGNIPPRSSLNEAATANMESFLDTLQMVLPAIRLDLFQSLRRTPPPKAIDTAEETLSLILTSPAKGLTARARSVDGEVIVEAGSQMVTDWVGSRKHSVGYQKRHADLIGSDVVSLGSPLSSLRTNYAFSSLSTATTVILGRSSNGRTEWKLPDGRSFAEWEDAKLSAITRGAPL